MTLHTLLAIAAISLSTLSGIGPGSPTLARAQAPAPPSGPLATPVWTLETDIASPESVYLDLPSQSLFVSNINGGAGERDGNGYISRLTLDGKPVAVKWVTGLNAPKGMRAAGRTLWVTDIDEVVGIDIAKGTVSTRVKIEGAVFLNDLAAAPDGTVYASDSTANKIFMVKDGLASVFAEGASAEVPNGLLVDGDRLLVGSMRQGADPKSEPGHLFALNRATKAKTVVSSATIGTIDGVESDGRGGHLVTNVMGGRILQVTAKGEVRPVIAVEPFAADLAYDPARRLVIIPHLNRNKVAAYDVSSLVQ